MDILEPLFDFITQLVGQLVNIPLTNPASYLYVLLNALLQLFAAFGGLLSGGAL